MDNRNTDVADRYLAAVHAAGQAVIAVKSGMGTLEVGIERAEAENETPYQAICTPRRFRGVPTTLHFLVAGEAAQVSLGLKWFDEIDLLEQHRAIAEVIRDWDGYWHPYPHFFSLRNGWSVDEVDEETKNLIWLARWQVRRRFRYEPERSVIEELALKIRDGQALSGVEAEKFVREHCRTAKPKTEKADLETTSAILKP